MFKDIEETIAALRREQQVACSLGIECDREYHLTNAEALNIIHGYLTLKKLLDAAVKEAHHWRANHDCQVAIKQRQHGIISDLHRQMKELEARIEYLDPGPMEELHWNKCPVCGGENIDGRETHIYENGAQQEVGCVECGSVWYNLYTLNAQEIFIDAREDDVE
jgi:hypothetical protein